MTEFVCPVCGYKTLGFPDSNQQRAKLGSMSSSAPPEPPPASLPEEKAAPPPPTPVSKRRSKPTAKKPERTTQPESSPKPVSTPKSQTDPRLPELRKEMQKLASDLAELDSLLNREVSALRARVRDLEERLAVVTKPPG